MKIRCVRANNRKRSFEVDTARGTLHMPYAKLSPAPTRQDRVVCAYVDPELGREGFTYELESGREGSVHVDALLEEHRDPAYMADLLAHELVVEARRRLESTHLSRREICRRLGTSATQLYRLLGQRNANASVRQVLALLSVLGCEVELRTRDAGDRTSDRRPSSRGVKSVALRRR